MYTIPGMRQHSNDHPANSQGIKTEVGDQRHARILRIKQNLWIHNRLLHIAMFRIYGGLFHQANNV